MMIIYQSNNNSVEQERERNREKKNLSSWTRLNTIIICYWRCQCFWPALHTGKFCFHLLSHSVGAFWYIVWIVRDSHSKSCEKSLTHGILLRITHALYVYWQYANRRCIMKMKWRLRRAMECNISIESMCVSVCIVRKQTITVQSIIHNWVIISFL